MGEITSGSVGALIEDQTRCFAEIAALLVAAIDEPWERVIVKADLDEDSVDALVRYYPTGTATYKQPRYIDGLAEAFYELGEVNTRVCGTFSSCTFTLEPTGEYDVHYQYADGPA